ncbi:hypothetical protein [Streptomyces griseosporeus]|uniref:hypothetical protein n=1 Tax=Streptomyces griseosporeus TaxID=1910 RepID=UPI0036F64269
MYGAPPSAFVTRRAELALAAKSDGRADDARRIRAARRPTLAAWTANLLLRAEPEESRRFLELGRALREAYRSLDATAIGELSEQRRRIVAALTRQAVQHARDAGQRLSDSVRQDVESTLRAVLADAQAADQWATGRLESALIPPSDFPSGPAAEAGTPRQPPPPPTRSRPQDELAERRRQRQERLEQARTAAEEAQRRLDDRRADHQDADTALRRAQDRQGQAERQQDDAQRQLTAAEEQLRQAQETHRTAQEQLNEAQEDLRHAARDRREAERRAHTTAEALTHAEQEAREATQQLKRLTRRRTDPSEKP